jgi:hypothetical protein
MHLVRNGEQRGKAERLRERMMDVNELPTASR